MTADTETHEAGQVRPFADVLLEVNRGRSHAELSDLLRELVTRVTATGKGGSLTYTLKIEPLKNAGDGALQVTDNVTAKMPSEPRQTAIFFATEDGQLVREHPRQPRLPLEGLDGGRGTIAAPGSAVSNG
jgi:hypothetical protein